MESALSIHPIFFFFFYLPYTAFLPFSFESQLEKTPFEENKLQEFQIAKNIEIWRISIMRYNLFFKKQM